MKTSHSLMHVTLASPSVRACAIAMLACLAALGTAHAVAYPGCPAVTDADFTMNTLVTRQGGNLNEPLRMAFDMNATGDLDIYFVEKAGKVRK